MKPLLFDKTEKNFSGRGICTLTDCLECKVTNAGKDEFEIELTYPLEGNNVDKIELGRIVYAPVNVSGNMQPFEIYRIERVLNGIITVYGQHVSYRLNRMILAPGAHGTYPAEIFRTIPSQIFGSSDFTFSGNHQGAVYWATSEPMSVRSALFGSEESLLNAYGSGLFYFDHFNVVFDEDSTVKRNHRIRYGINMLDLKNDVSIGEITTAVVPYFVAKNGLLTFIDWSQNVNENNIVKSEYWSEENNFVETLNVTDQFEPPEDVEEWWRPTDVEMYSAAMSYMMRNKTFEPSQNIDVSFVDLRRSTEYEDWSFLEDILINDTIEVVYEQLGVKAEARVVKTVYDVIAERYESIELGTLKSTLFDYFKKLK